MTLIQKALFEEIKAHIKHDIEGDPVNYAGFEQYLNGIKFESMTYDHNREVFTMCYPGDISLTRYTVKTRFRAKKYEDNIAIWQVNVYSDGTVSVYFDGTKYVA